MISILTIKQNQLSLLQYCSSYEYTVYVTKYTVLLYIQNILYYYTVNILQFKMYSLKSLDAMKLKDLPSPICP